VCLAARQEGERDPARLTDDALKGVIPAAARSSLLPGVVERATRLCRNEVIVPVIIHSHGGWAEPRTQLRFHANIGESSLARSDASCRGAIMAIAEPLGPTEDKQLEAGAHIHKLARAGSTFQHTEGDEGEVSTESLGNLLRQVSKTSMDEIDGLIAELQTLRRKLQSDGDRIQCDITKHADLSQQVIQLTTIISDSVKKLPATSAIS